MANQQDFEQVQSNAQEEMPVMQTKAVKKKKSNLGKLFLALVVASGVGFGAFAVMGGNVTELTGFAKQEEGGMAQVAEDVAFYSAMPKITVNLLSGNGQDEFVKVGAVLEYSDQNMEEIIFNRQARIIDSFTSLLRNLRVTDIKGSAGTQLLREELTKRANLVLHPHAINTVRFQEIIIQ